MPVKTITNSSILFSMYHLTTDLFVLLLITLISTANTQAAEKTVYTLGVVPQFETHHLHAVWGPIINELEQRTGFDFKLAGSPSIPDFEREFLAGKFDFAYMNPYHLLIAHKSQGYRPLVRDHGKQLYGVLTVRKDGSIKNIQDLNEKIVAFPAPNALGASLMIRADLENIHHINIHPNYVKTHDSVYLNVVMNQAAAGGGVQKTLNSQPEQIRNLLEVIYTTRKVAPHPLVTHPRVANDVSTKVLQALLAMGEDEKGKQLLNQIPIKQIGMATMDDYQPLAEMGLEKFYVQ